VNKKWLAVDVKLRIAAILDNFQAGIHRRAYALRAR
jgi:hypothetical protein